jgi:nucleoside-diphosphate-sugar epimerase
MILVTGATGLAGSGVIREFARQKAPVRALVRDRVKPRAKEWCIPRRMSRWAFVPPPSRRLRAAMPLSCVARWCDRNGAWRSLRTADDLLATRP